MIASSLQDIKSASIKVVEATHAWRAANREYYNRWSLVRPVDNDAPPPAIFFGDGSPDGNDSLLLPPSHSMIVGDWSQNFNTSKTGPGGDASGSFFQAWKGGDKAANSIGMNGPHAASNVSMASSRRTHQASSPVTTAAPTIFLYKGVQYLHKMKEDLNFLSASGIASYLHVEVNHNVVLMDKKRVVEATITEPNCRGRNFFARLSAPKGTLAISRAAGHLDPDEYGIKELQKAAEDERSINVWFRSQTAAERQVIPPPPSKHRGPRAPTFNLFKVVVPHNWRRALEEEQSHVLPARPLSALAGPSSMENRPKHVHLQSKRSPPSRPLSAALTRKEMQAAADKEAFDSQMQMFESLSKTQPVEHQSLMTVSKLRNRVKSIHGRVPSSADYQTRLTRRHPLQRFATVDAPNDQWLQSSAKHAGDSNHPAGRAAAAAVGLRPPSASLHISLAASGLAVPSTVKARRGSIIEGARYSSTHLSASVSSYRGPVSNATTPVPSARSFNHTQSFRAHPLPPGWDGMFAVILGILFYRKVRQRALERCSATKVQKWYRRCRAQALCGKMIEDALAANSELMAWLMSLAESQRRRGSKAPPVPPSPGSVVSSNPRRSSAIPRYSNAMQLFRYYSVAATKIQRQYRGRLRRITMLNMIGKLIAVLKMQRWARNMLDAMRLLRAAYLMRVGKSILKWMRLCRLRAAAREFRRRQWCAIHIQRFYRCIIQSTPLVSNSPIFKCDAAVPLLLRCSYENSAAISWAVAQDYDAEHDWEINCCSENAAMGTQHARRNEIVASSVPHACRQEYPQVDAPVSTARGSERIPAKAMVRYSHSTILPNRSVQGTLAHPQEAAQCSHRYSTCGARMARTEAQCSHRYSTCGARMARTKSCQAGAPRRHRVEVYQSKTVVSSFNVWCEDGEDEIVPSRRTTSPPC
ncbi:IQ calmodulin-binding protein, putative [Bodo saltans]|uniref:IQ calmodulin-binding protein, putative n=1 Tax=Bodo saltans TaxID=75058 RepID=A0A0S4J7Z4_BODSA|nr:IQ calmodulin-binding protein, putative [Bodo saltans]|eukprot:CUG81997.1 IQ calmodulin-binding protein, putative [Bodo saltans]